MRTLVPQYRLIRALEGKIVHVDTSDRFPRHTFRSVSPISAGNRCNERAGLG